MRFARPHRILPLFSLPVVFVTAASAPSLPPISVNQNHTSSGALRNGVLTLGLEIGKGDWRPEADDGMTLSVYAFGEAGHGLQNPGPLIRVPQGTEIRASLHNTLDVAITVHGLRDPEAGPDTGIRVAAGATEPVRFKAATPGLYCYWGASEVDDLKLRHGVDSELTGAFVVDPPGAPTNEEVFVIEMISEIPGPGARKMIATINGKSWPYTQRFHYEAGQPVRWRWVNASNEPHALHLHGFYYRVDAFNRGGRTETYSGDSRPMVVTQRVAVGETFDMSWSPDRPGNWLFHCHMVMHMTPAVVPPLPGLSIRPASGHADTHGSIHDAAGMGQLVLGITVPRGAGTAPVAKDVARKLQLDISERPGFPRYVLELRRAGQTAQPDKPALIGPPIVLTRGQPVEIDVVNKLKEPTAIHWHGIELESYYDGVPGWSGVGSQTTPPIAPGGSFVARMTPPRAGTFIYHTHWHDEAQLMNGVYGPLIVLPSGETFDPALDLTFVFSLGSFGTLGELALINGTPQGKMLQLTAGKTYRFRFINIAPNNQAMQVSLQGSSGPVEWKIIAKDGADLRRDAVRPTRAQLTITVGETYDVEFSAAAPQDLLLDLLLPGQKIHTSQALSFMPPPDRN